MPCISNTGLISSTGVHPRQFEKQKEIIELKCDVLPAPFVLRPYAGLYNPFSPACSILCNHPANTEARQFVKKVKSTVLVDCKGHHFGEDLSKQDKNRTPRDIVTEDMFRRYTETDSRPLTPAPTITSAKSRGSRRCYTPDQPHEKTTIVVDLRRSHSQETIYYHGHTTSDSMTGGFNDGSTLPSLILSDTAHNRRLKSKSEHLPPLASPLALTKRAVTSKGDAKTARNIQLKALNLGKIAKNKKKSDGPASNRRAKGNQENGSNRHDGSEDPLIESVGESDMRRRGKRRKKCRLGSDRLTSAGLAAQSQQDPETQIAGIGSDSKNPSSRGSIAAAIESEIMLPLPVIKSVDARKTDSFLDDDILKYLHREVDEDAIQNEFDVKRRYVLEEALRTRPIRPYGVEMQMLLKEYKVPEPSLGDWLHIPRIFSRVNVTFSLPMHSDYLESLTPMTYAARYVTLKKSKQLLYLTVLRKFRTSGYRMPMKDIESGLVLMMGGILVKEQADAFKKIMDWDNHVEEENFKDDIKLTIQSGLNKNSFGDHVTQVEENTLKFRTWCGVCGVCERLYGRFPTRAIDPPDGIELSDFSMLETQLPNLKLHPGLSEILHAIRTR